MTKDISIGWLCIDVADAVAQARWSELVGRKVGVDEEGEAIPRRGAIPLVLLDVHEGSIREMPIEGVP